MRVVRGPRNDGRWYWRAEEHSGATSTTKWTGWATTEEADKACASIVAGFAGPRSADDCRTVRDLLSLWHGAQEGRADLSPTTATSYGGAAVRVRDIVGDVAIDRVDAVVVARVRDQSLRAGRTHRTVQTDLKMFRMAWRWGQSLDLVPPRDFPHVPLRLPELRHHCPTPAEVADVLARLDGATRIHALLLHGTGCRLTEIGALRWGSVTLSQRDDGRWVGSLSVSGKGGRPRSVPLTPPVAEALMVWREAGKSESDTLVLRRSTPSSKSILHRDLTRLGVDWTPHDLRRAAVDALYRCGVDVGTAAGLLGHSPQVALRHYRQVVDSDLTAAASMARLGYLPEAGDVIELDAARRERQSR